MEWLNDIKEKYSKRRIRNLDRSEEYSRDFVDIESAKRIGIIVNMNSISPDDLSLLKNYIELIRWRNNTIKVYLLNSY